MKWCNWSGWYGGVNGFVCFIKWNWIAWHEIMNAGWINWHSMPIANREANVAFNAVGDFYDQATLLLANIQLRFCYQYDQLNFTNSFFKCWIDQLFSRVVI